MNKYNREGYYDPVAYAALSRIEQQEKKKKRKKTVSKEPSFPLVYICSPYSGDKKRNTENAQKYSRYAINKGCLPITPHIYFTQFLNDDDPKERSHAFGLNQILLRKCKELWIFGNSISKGMKKEISSKNQNCRHGIC